jgi:DNA-3-methyladenine glycosylase
MHAHDVFPATGRRLAPADYADGNTARIARFFLGKVLCVRAADGYAEGMIIETEAYGGIEDAASHAYKGRRTARTEVMYAPGGAAYVYFCYGIHSMFNIITGPKDDPQAVLVRAVKIVAGHDLVRRRRKGMAEKDWASGPGRICTALGIGLHHNKSDLASGETIWIEDRGVKVSKKEITAGPRIGIDYAGDWVQVPWRFVWKRICPVMPPNGAPAFLRAGRAHRSPS